jgi:hypothetical protein
MVVVGLMWGVAITVLAANALVSLWLLRSGQVAMPHKLAWLGLVWLVPLAGCSIAWLRLTEERHQAHYRKAFGTRRGH